MATDIVGDTFVDASIEAVLEPIVEVEMVVVVDSLSAVAIQEVDGLLDKGPTDDVISFVVDSEIKISFELIDDVASNTTTRRAVEISLDSLVEFIEEV